MKRKISKKDYEKLSDELKALYKESGDDYKLELEDEPENKDEDVGPLKRALEREREELKEFKTKYKDVKDKLDELDTNDARKKGDIETLEKSWKQKLVDLKTTHKEQLTKIQGQLTNHLVDNIAIKLAGEISSAPKLLIPHIKARLQANFEGDEPTTRILDKDGKPSALTIDELKKEFVDNADYSAIIVGSKASGGARSSNNGGAVPLTRDADGRPIDLAKLSPHELTARIKSVAATDDSDSE